MNTQQESIIQMWKNLRQEHYVYQVLTNKEDLIKHIDFVFFNPQWSWTNTLLIHFMAKQLNLPVSIMRTKEEWKGLFETLGLPAIEESKKQFIEYTPVLLEIEKDQNWYISQVDSDKQIDIQAYELLPGQTMLIQDGSHYLMKCINELSKFGNVTNILCQDFGTDIDGVEDKLRFAFQAIAQRFVQENTGSDTYIDCLTEVFLYAFLKANKERYDIKLTPNIIQEDALDLYVVLFNALHMLPEHIEYELKRKLQFNKNREKLEMRNRLKEMTLSKRMMKISQIKREKRIEEMMDEDSEDMMDNGS